MKENTLNNKTQIAVFEEKIERINCWIEIAKNKRASKEFITQLEDGIIKVTERIKELKTQENATKV